MLHAIKLKLFDMIYHMTTTPVLDHSTDIKNDTDIVVLQDLTKHFGSFHAVKGISFTVKQGEVFGFLGPNGAGKSTTIRMILNILRPTSGSVSLFGSAHNNVAALHKRLGYLSGDMAMDTNLTGRQYLNFVAAQYDTDCRANQSQMAELLQANIDVKIGNYSRGNRQKIGLIAALQHEPELLVLDEPTSGFDPLVQEQFASIIRDFKAKGGTVFMSSHILSEVQQLCDRVAFIKDGQIIDTTTIQGLTEHAAKRVRIKAPIAELKELRLAVAKLHDATVQVSVEDYDLEFSYGGGAQALLKLLAGFSIQDITIKEPDLEEIFMHYYEKQDTPAAPTAPASGRQL
jgi:ABC-2 type transport system ATP-binding protein